MKGYLYRKAYLPIIAYLKQGMSPKKLAISVAFGCVLGIIPFLGVTTLLCAFASLLFRLNMGVIQIVNYLVYPLQLLLFIPFVKAGVYVFDVAPFPFSMELITAMLKESALDLVIKLGYFNVLGIGVWFGLAPFIMLIIYYLGYLLFSRTSSLKN